MLRGCVVAVGIAGVALGVILIAAGDAIPGAIELLVTGLILVLALVFERRGYRPNVNRSEGRWEETGEKFVDPVSGHLIEVLYNPDTGQRDYVDKGHTG